MVSLKSWARAARIFPPSFICCAENSRGGPSDMKYEAILVEARGRVLLITLNRPKALNAINAQLAGELIDAVAAGDADPDVRCFVITGSEKAFAAGADIKE